MYISEENLLFCYISASFALMEADILAKYKELRDKYELTDEKVCEILQISQSTLKNGKYRNKWRQRFIDLTSLIEGKIYEKLQKVDI